MTLSIFVNPLNLHAKSRWLWLLTLTLTLSIFVNPLNLHAKSRWLCLFRATLELRKGKGKARYVWDLSSFKKDKHSLLIPSFHLPFSFKRFFPFFNRSLLVLNGSQLSLDGFCHCTFVQCFLSQPVYLIFLCLQLGSFLWVFRGQPINAEKLLIKILLDFV